MFSLLNKKNVRQQPELELRQESLQCVPVKNPELQEQETNGELRLTYAVRVKPWFSRVFKTVAGRENDTIDRKLQLDTLGTSVWRMIDGVRNVDDIIRLFQDDHKLNRREAEISVSSFLKELGKRGLIAMRQGED